jgi:hypothetical protein
MRRHGSHDDYTSGRRDHGAKSRAAGGGVGSRGGAGCDGVRGALFGSHAEHVIRDAGCAVATPMPRAA